MSRSARSGSATAAFAEVHLAHARVGTDLLRRAVHEDVAADHDDDAAREAEHDVHVVLDEEHGEVLRKARDRREKLCALVLRHAGGRLVEQKHARARGERERSEEHTSELQSHLNLVCRLLLEKKKKKRNKLYISKKKIK